MKIIVVVKGHPRPQPRPRFIKGRAVSCADPLASAWKARIKDTASKVPFKLPKGAIACSMQFLMPTKDQARIGTAHTNVPDLDNLAKLVLDAIQDTGLLANDSQVAELNLAKAWSSQGQAGVTIELESWNEVSDDETMPPPDWIK